MQGPCIPRHDVLGQKQNYIGEEPIGASASLGSVRMLSYGSGGDELLQLEQR
jgi:hypothetical protein